MPLVQRQSRFNNSRSRTVTALLPFDRIDDRIAGRKSQNAIDHFCERIRIAPNRTEELVVLRCFTNCVDNWLSLRCYKNGNYEARVAGFMKILEIQGVVAYLVQSCGSEFIFANLEFQHKDCWTDDKDDIDAFSHSGDCILEVNGTFLL